MASQQNTKDPLCVCDLGMGRDSDEGQEVTQQGQGIVRRLKMSVSWTKIVQISIAIFKSTYVWRRKSTKRNQKNLHFPLF